MKFGKRGVIHFQFRVAGQLSWSSEEEKSHKTELQLNTTLYYSSNLNPSSPMKSNNIVKFALHEESILLFLCFLFFLFSLFFLCRERERERERE
jgi:hypothetical protein